MRAMILYEHCSPHQVTAVEAARKLFTEQGHTLIPVEFYFGSRDYSWTLADKQRNSEWRCLFPDKKQVSNWQLFHAIRRLVKEHRIDIVAVNGWYGLFAWWLVLLKRWVGCKIVLVSDSVSLERKRSYFKEMPKKWFMGGIDAAFVAGQAAEDYLHTLGVPRESMTYGIDVVDNALYAHIPLRSAPINRPIIVGSAARMIPEKNLPVAVRAWSEVARKHPELQMEWHLAGQGPLEQSVRQIATELKAPVVFRGFVGYDDMPGFYAGLDLYWQPSLSDSWGLVVNEAMAAGLPVLVSNRCGCYRDLVQPANGWVHDVTMEGLMHGLEQALARRDEWPGYGHASRTVIARWDTGRYAQGLLDACRLACGQPVQSVKDGSGSCPA